MKGLLTKRLKRYKGLISNRVGEDNREDSHIVALVSPKWKGGHPKKKVVLVKEEDDENGAPKH